MGGTSPEEAGRAATLRRAQERRRRVTDTRAAVPNGASLSGNRFADVMMTSSADTKFDPVWPEF